MTDALKPAQTPFRKVVSWWKWLVAAWAPIQSIYQFGVKTHLTKTDLPHVLFYICWFAGVHIAAWIVMTGILVTILLILLVLFTNKSPARDIGAAVSLLLAGIIALGMVIRIIFLEAPAMHSPSALEFTAFGTWIVAALGAACLGWVYVSIFNQVRAALAE